MSDTPTETIEDHEYRCQDCGEIQDLTTLLTEARIKEVEYLTSEVNSVKGECASFLPKDFDGITNWPVVQEPVIIIPQIIIEDRIAALLKTNQEGGK